MDRLLGWVDLHRLEALEDSRQRGFLEVRHLGLQEEEDHLEECLLGLVDHPASAVFPVGLLLDFNLRLAFRDHPAKVEGFHLQDLVEDNWERTLLEDASTFISPVPKGSSYSLQQIYVRPSVKAPHVFPKGLCSSEVRPWRLFALNESIRSYILKRAFGTSMIPDEKLFVVQPKH